MKTYQDLIVWQKSIELALEVYKLTEKFPKEEIYGLVSQINRAVVSISSNIAEGKMRGGNIEFKRFLSAFWSAENLDFYYCFYSRNNSILERRFGVYASISGKQSKEN